MKNPLIVYNINENMFEGMVIFYLKHLLNGLREVLTMAHIFFFRRDIQNNKTRGGNGIFTPTVNVLMEQ